MQYVFITNLLLFQLVKEQKGRIAELSKAKHEQGAEYKVRRPVSLYQTIQVSHYIIVSSDIGVCVIAVSYCCVALFPWYSLCQWLFDLCNRTGFRCWKPMQRRPEKGCYRWSYSNRQRLGIVQLTVLFQTVGLLKQENYQGKGVANCFKIQHY